MKSAEETFGESVSSNKKPPTQRNLVITVLLVAGATFVAYSALSQKEQTDNEISVQTTEAPYSVEDEHSKKEEALLNANCTASEGENTWSCPEQTKLPNALLSHLDLSGISLRDASLADADLSGADLTDADLSGIDLTNANLSDSMLSGANLVGADLTGANLQRVNLDGADLTDATMIRVNLGDASLIGTNLSNVDLIRANLTAADLTGSVLTGADLTGADMRRVLGINLTGATVHASTAAPRTGPSDACRRSLAKVDSLAGDWDVSADTFDLYFEQSLNLCSSRAIWLDEATTSIAGMLTAACMLYPDTTVCR
jgi:uncharacterized protein YjbI with pentapeptide repeats